MGSRIGEPFDGSDFEDTCEDCGAVPGSLCRDNCPSGYSSFTRERHAELINKYKTKRPCDEFPACGANCVCR